MARGNQLTPRGEILTAINISKNSLDIGKSQTINKEGLINEETLTRFCRGQNDCTQEDQNQSAKVNAQNQKLANPCGEWSTDCCCGSNGSLHPKT